MSCAGSSAPRPRSCDAHPWAPIAASDPALVLRLRLRPPYDSDAVGGFLAPRAVDGLERHERTPAGWTHRRVVPLGRRTAVAEVRVVGDHVVVRSDTDIRDTAALVRRVRRWLDLDADPRTVDAALAADPALGPLVTARPGLRVPTTVDPWETVVRAIIGQQVSVAGARTILGRIVRGVRIARSRKALLRFPTPRELAETAPEDISVLGMPRSRGRAVHAAAVAVADGTVDLRSGDPDAVEEALLALPGIGPWTASYVRLRGLSGIPMPSPRPTSAACATRPSHSASPPTPRLLADHALRWSPWRSYAAEHLWTASHDRPTPAHREQP